MLLTSSKDSPFIQKVYRLDPGDIMGILSKGLSEDNMPSLEIFLDNFILVSGDSFSSAARKYFDTQWPSQPPAVYGP